MANNNNKQQEESDLIDRLVAVNRTAKVVKGGRRFGFSALVVVGDGKGRVGFGKGKAKEVIDAKRKATEAAKKSMIKVPLKEGRTFHHDIETKAGAGRILVRSAQPGTGIIAGGPARAVFEALGVSDVVAKSTGSSNPYNIVASTFRALELVQSPKVTAARRGKKISDIISQREVNTKDAPAAEAKPKKKASKKAAS
jgi:small subunit ribosomal protein S5